MVAKVMRERYSSAYMAHPFTRQFEKALHESSEFENLVLVEAEKLIKKGYRATEIHGVLVALGKGRIDDTETAIVDEAIEELSRYLDND